MCDSASLSVSRGMASSQLYFRQELFVLLHQHQVYEPLQRLGTTKHLYHLGPPLQFLDQPFQLVGGVKDHVPSSDVKRVPSGAQATRLAPPPLPLRGFSFFSCVP